MIAQQAEQTKAVAPASAKQGTNGVTEDFCQFATCRIGQEEFAIDILSVQEINRMGEITKVPRAPSFVEGVINLRGRIIPVLDLRQRLGTPAAERTAQSRIVVVNVSGRVIGLIVDAVSEVLRVARSGIEPPPSTGASACAAFIQGVSCLNGRLLTVLDLNRLLTSGG